MLKMAYLERTTFMTLLRLGRSRALQQERENGTTRERLKTLMRSSQQSLSCNSLGADIGSGLEYRALANTI
jgi:hypothetical protein